MLKQRVVTASWLVLLVLAGLFLLESAAFSLFAAFVVALGAWEWGKMAGIESFPDQLGYTVAVPLIAGTLGFAPALQVPAIAIAMLWWLFSIGLVIGYPSSSSMLECRKVRLLGGVLMLAPAWLALVLLKEQGNGLLLLALLLVWGADIGGYFVGSSYGRVKLAPEVSPGKTREGVYGGLFIAAGIIVVASLGMGWSLGQLLVALIGAVLVVVLSVVGDLTVSVFKRQAGVKDTGRLLPGHGGVMDRIDSLCAALPMFVLLLWLNGWGNA